MDDPETNGNGDKSSKDDSPKGKVELLVRKWGKNDHLLNLFFLEQGADNAANPGVNEKRIKLGIFSGDHFGLAPTSGSYFSPDVRPN